MGSLWRHDLVDKFIPVVLWKRKPIQVPGDVRGWIPCSYAFERHWRPGLHGLVDELVQQLGMCSCQHKSGQYIFILGNSFLSVFSSV